MNHSSARNKSVSRFLVLGVCLICLAGCVAPDIIDAYFNNTTTLGGDVPGLRSNINVSFINNTPYRAILTFGTYDPLNTEQGHALSFPPLFEQFSLDPDPNYRLERNSKSQVFTFTCGRALSVGMAKSVPGT